MKTWLKKNKALLLLPLALLPFVVLIFYILGGGKNAEKEQKTAETTPTGINYVLPEADKSITIFDKMEAYEQQVSATATTDYNILEESDTLAETTQVKSQTENEGTGSETAVDTDHQKICWLTSGTKSQLSKKNWKKDRKRRIFRRKLQPEKPFHAKIQAGTQLAGKKRQRPGLTRKQHNNKP
jgi:hypothetical protein